MRKQQKIAGGVLIILVAVVLWTEADRPVGAAPSAVKAPSQPAEPIAATRIAMPARVGMPALERDPFATETPKQPKKSAAAAAPAAPANPYRFAGEMRVGGETQRFLVHGDEILGTKAGDVLMEGWKVEAVSARQIVLVHSSGVRQVLAVGAHASENSARNRQVAESAAPASDAVAPLDLVPPANLPTDYFLRVGVPVTSGGR